MFTVSRLVPASPMPAQRTQPFSRRGLVGLFGFLLLCLGISALGGLVTLSSVGGWYQGISKPAFNPPDWVFAPVWTSLFLMMAVAGWRVWLMESAPERRRALTVFGVQLLLNLGWSVLFFGIQNIGAALAEVVLLWLLIAVNTVMFWRLDHAAGLLFIPYLAWVGFAILLNAALWHLNG